MTHPPLPPAAGLYPPDVVRALREAVLLWPRGDDGRGHIRRINQITDQLAAAGLCRPRGDSSMRERAEGVGADADKRG